MSVTDYFTRVKSRYAPHNVYSKLSTLRKLIGDRKWPVSATVPSWKFADTVVPTAESAQTVIVNFSLPSYRVTFNYDAASSVYKRTMAGVVHVDAETKQQLSAKTVIVQQVRITDIPNDPKLRVEIDLDSGGHAYIFHNGSVVHAEWKKTGNRTRYYGTDGAEIILPRGQIWIAIAPNTSGAVLYQ
jgi:hypothetical protein